MAEGVAFMSSDMIGFIILDFILGLILRRMVSVPLVVKISRMNRNDGSRHPASFGVPTDMVSNLELRTHGFLSLDPPSGG